MSKAPSQFRKMPKNLSLKLKLSIAYIIFVAVYGLFVLLPHPNPITLARYGVSVTGLRLIDVSLIVVLALIWLTGFYGYFKLKNYCELIAKDRDGRNVAVLSRGVLMLVLWLPISGSVMAILDYLTMHNPGMKVATDLINDYINLIIPLIGFVFISFGARGLSELAHNRPSHRAINLMAGSLIFIGLAYFQLV
jgi:hypothetical protein